MNCLEIRELLSPYQDGMLEEEQRIQVERHLQECEQCRQELEELRFVVELMQGSVEGFAPQGFSQLVMERVNAQVVTEPVINWRQGLLNLMPGKWNWHQKAKPNTGTTRGWSWGRISAVAAMLVVALAVSLQINHLSPFGVGSMLSKNSVGDSLQTEQSVALLPAAPSTGQERALSSTAVQDKMEQYSTQDAGDAASQNINGRNMAPKAKVTGEQQAGSLASAERKIIKNGRVQLEVTNVDKTYSQIMQKVKAAGGYVESSSFNNSPEGTPQEEQYHTGNLVIRIPVSQFENFFALIKTQGTVTAQELHGQDVSTEFYDTQARIRNWKQQEARLLEILKQAKNVEEILRVENELQRVRQEVEVMEGRIRSLSNLSEMATLELTLTQVKANNVIVLPEKNILQQAGEAFIQSVNTLLQVLGDLVVLLGGLAPVLLLLILVGGGYILYRRWKSNKNKK